MGSERAVIVGAGMGGLAAAIDLARAGLTVTLLESAASPGGKVRQLEVDGAKIDSGPTVLTMRWAFEELFADAGKSLEARVRMTRASVLARYSWGEDDRLDLFADPERTAAELGRFAGAAAVRGYQAFRLRAKEVYETLEPSFIRAPRPTPLSLVQSAGLIPMLRIRPFATLWNELGNYFEDPRLRQVFARFATYCGSSPFAAPATLMLVAHVEMAGVWHVEGGMQRLPEEMSRLARELGVSERYGATVSDVVLERGRAAGVVLSTGERIDAKVVVLNCDASAIASGRLGRAAARAVPQVAPEARSLSALTFSLNLEVSGFPLSRHNVFFCADYAAEFRDLFEKGRLPEAPTVYVCAQDRGDGETARTGPERLFCIVNAPPTGDREPFHQADIEPCAQRAFDLLRRSGVRLEPTPKTCRSTTPSDFEARFPGTGGAIYGRATHGSMATFRRPSSRSAMPGLYLAGGSVHPGPGVPMAMLSGRLAASSVLQDLPSTGRFRQAATPGGTPTH